MRKDVKIEAEREVKKMYIAKVANTEEGDLVYFGIGCCGNEKLINKLTGSLPLLR